MVSHHEVILSAPRDLAVGGAPAILQRSDEDFIEAVLTSLRDADGRIGLRASLARSVSVAGGTDTRPSSKRNSGRGLFNKLRDASRQLGLAGGRVAAPPVLESAPGSDQQLVEGIRRSAEGAQVLKLFQPIQRQFNLAVMEARCDTPGEPRIDPTRVDSAGMVIRRLVRDSQGREVKQGWMRAGKASRAGPASARRPTALPAATATTPKRCVGLAGRRPASRSSTTRYSRCWRPRKTRCSTSRWCRCSSLRPTSARPRRPRCSTA
jgi:hypothetical protein